MTRSTSSNAYNILKESGKLESQQGKIYEALYINGPLTRSEVAAFIGYKGYASNISTRLCELREMGLVKESGEAVCSMTNLTVILWEVTENLPIKPKKKISRLQQAIRFIEEKSLLEEFKNKYNEEE